MRKWTRFPDLPRRFLRAYEYNTARCPDFSENRLPNGALIFQSGGAFAELKFRSVKMSRVCCGVIAAYNAMVLAGESVDFLKLSAEFECSASVPAIPHGLFGNFPSGIGRCFSAYGLRSRKYKTLAEFENALTTGKTGVLSYKFGRIDPRIHTFAVTRTKSGAVAYNHFSDLRGTETAETVAEILKPQNVFLVGDILDSF